MSLLLALTGGAAPTAITISANTTGAFAATGGLTNAEDLRLFEPAPTTNYANSAQIKITSWDVGDRNHSLFRFNDLSTVGAGTITDAEFGIWIENSITTAHAIEIRPLSRAYVESQATWNQYSTGNNWGTAGALGAADRGSSLATATTTVATGYWLTFSGAALNA